MHMYGQNYRPPFEAQSLLLQVTTGCSHNACAFCAMYRQTRYTESPLHEIESDLYEAARYLPNATRVFLENGDAFGLPAERLLEVAELIHKYLPNVTTIGAYASIKNIIPKTDDELKALAEAGYAHINIGLESGLDDVLAYLKKGTTLFGSGWVWLSADKDGKLVITQEANAANPIQKGLTPLLTFDVWEHAYYLDYQNRRPDHLAALWQIVDWKAVEGRAKS